MGDIHEDDNLSESGPDIGEDFSDDIQVDGYGSEDEDDFDDPYAELEDDDDELGLDSDDYNYIEKEYGFGKNTLHDDFEFDTPDSQV